MKVLFVTRIIEHPAAGGAQLRIENSIKALNRVCELHIISTTNQANIGGIKAEMFYRSYCKEFAYSPSVTQLHENRCIRGLQMLYSFAIAKDYIDIDARYILETVNNNKIDLVWVGYGNISFPLIRKIKQIMPDMKLVCDTDSVWSKFIMRELPYVSDSRRKAKIEKIGRAKELEEKEWTNLCEITTAVSEVDAKYYRKLGKDPDRIKIFSNVIDMESYNNIPAPPTDFRRPCIYLAGTFRRKTAMDHAARWVIDEVLPIVKKKIPDIHFYIVGRGSKQTLCDVNNPDITITGKLSSVLPYLCNSDVSIVPLKFESGTRFKILEAGICSVPIISTTLGAEGIPVKNKEDIVIADMPLTFAEGIIKIIQDKQFAEKLAGNCKQLVQKYYGIDSLAHQAKEILKHFEN